MTKTKMGLAFATALVIATGFFGLPFLSHREEINKINPAIVNVDIAKSFEPDGKVLLHMEDIKSKQGIELVQVYLRCVVPDPNGDLGPATSHVAQIDLNSEVGSSIRERVIDVTKPFHELNEYAPPLVANFEVMFVVVPKNNGVKLDPDSFDVKSTWFEFLTKDGKQAPQKPHQEVTTGHYTTPNNFKAEKN